jgi:hypothetical protein
MGAAGARWGIAQREPGMTATYGQTVDGLSVAGAPVQATVFNEHQVRAAAGLTMALGALAFAYAALARVYAPIQIVTALFFVEFALRVAWGLNRSPLGLLAGWMVRRRPPDWASARPKRFAWTLGLVMSLAMTLITNLGIRGALPLSICLACLVLMWLESVLGLCLGCEIHGLLVRRGWIARDPAFEICPHGACAMPVAPRGDA